MSYPITRTGNVSQGCLSMLEELPIEKVAVKDLHALVTNKGTFAHYSQTIQPKPVTHSATDLRKVLFPIPDSLTD
jgi:hypothetical protein